MADNRIYTWKGQNVETLSREELIEAVKDATDMIRHQQVEHHKDIQMLGSLSLTPRMRPIFRTLIDA